MKKRDKERLQGVCDGDRSKVNVVEEFGVRMKESGRKQPGDEGRSGTI